MKSGSSVIAILVATLWTVEPQACPAQGVAGEASQGKGARGLADPTGPAEAKPQNPAPGGADGARPSGDPAGAPDGSAGSSTSLSSNFKSSPYVDLTNRYIFVERYTKFEERAVEGVIGQYKVGITEILRDSINLGQADSKQTEITRQTLFTERPAEVNSLGVVAATVRNYSRFQVRPDDVVRAPGPRALDGLTIWYRPQNGEMPQILSLSEDRRLREREYAVASRQVFLPNLALALPSFPARVGDTWRIPRRAVQAMLGEATIRGDSLVGRFVELRREDKGSRRIAVLSITGRIGNPAGDTVINAEIRFTFLPQATQPAPTTTGATANTGTGGTTSRPRGKAGVDTIEARGAITDLRLARVATGILPGSKGKQRFKASQELTLQRHVGVDGATLNVPETPAATDVNSWLTYIDPTGRFFFHHPQDYLPPERFQFIPNDESLNMLTLVKSRPEGPDLIRISIYEKPLKEDDLRGMLEAEWEPTRLEVLKGEEEWLPESDWPNGKVFRVEAALKTSERAKGSSRLHYDGYLLLLGPRLSAMTVATTPRDAVSSYRRDIELMLRTFKLGFPAGPVTRPTGDSPKGIGSMVEPSEFTDGTAPIEAVLEKLGTTRDGLSWQEARRRLASRTPGLRRTSTVVQALVLFLRQFTNPIILILLVAATLSIVLGDLTDGLIILSIVLISGLLGFWQEWGAADAVAKLLDLVQIRASVLRDGVPVEVPLAEIVPGDVVRLGAGDVVPGDGRLLDDARDLFVNEATLTGETFPAEKHPGTLPAAGPIASRTNCLFLGTSVVSGSGRLLVVHTGKDAEFGRISETLRLRPPETEFERGIRRFGAMLVEVTLLLVLGIFAVNVALQRPVLESFLFAIAIAVGLTPQLLPAIISVNLSHGARRMAECRVIVRRLSAIEDLGGMDVLCSDKTGTITEGKVRLLETIDASGVPSERVRLHAFINAALQAGYNNPIDRAITAEPRKIDGYRRLDEEPYDFVRKRLSLLVAPPSGEHVLIAKGALANILDVCESVETSPGVVEPLAAAQEHINTLFHDRSDRGFRVLGLATRRMGSAERAEKSDEAGMTFLGLLVFDDPLRPGIVETVRGLREQGVALKLISGDNRRVVAHAAGLAEIVGDGELLTGEDLAQLSDDALIPRASRASVFAEIEPNQKERIVRALKKAGHVVGYLGDGVNDAPALHAADVGISVADAVDVAREAAQIVLLEKNLTVLGDGIREGRRTFANTLKYIFMATSSNFGNMFSMAGASLILPFLPLLPKQVLLTNLLTDLPEMTIATDAVDPEMVDGPRRWDLRFIRRFMITFGIVSSAFDLLTFAVLLRVLKATPGQLRTGWFLESVLSAALIVLVIRTRRFPLRSLPARPLLFATLAVITVTPVIPYLPIAGVLGFEPLPAWYLIVLLGIVITYLAAAETAKSWFYRTLVARDRR